MKTLLGTLVAVCLLAATSANGAPVATVRAIGDGPILRYDATPLVGKKPGGFSVDTISPAGETNIMLQFHRNGLPDISKYDFLSELEAWGELEAILVIDADIAANSAGYYARGNYSVLYNGVSDLIAGGKTYSTGTRLLFGSITFDDSNIWGYPRSDVGCCYSSLPNPFEFDFGTIQQDGYITTANLEAARFYSTVPEPGMWAIMIIGVAAIGGTLRARRLAGFAPA